jgi:hypothetical protein
LDLYFAFPTLLESKSQGKEFLTGSYAPRGAVHRPA